MLCVLSLTRKIKKYDFWLADKQVETRSNTKRYNCSSQRKKLETSLGFHGKRKNNLPMNSTTPTNSIPLPASASSGTTNNIVIQALHKLMIEYPEDTRRRSTSIRRRVFTE